MARLAERGAAIKAPQNVGMSARILAGPDAKPLNQFGQRRRMVAFEGFGRPAPLANAVTLTHRFHPPPVLRHLPDGCVQARDAALPVVGVLAPVTFAARHRSIWMRCPECLACLANLSLRVISMPISSAVICAFRPAEPKPSLLRVCDADDSLCFATAVHAGCKT
jgi:hypothetical protein